MRIRCWKRGSPPMDRTFFLATHCVPTCCSFAPSMKRCSKLSELLGLSSLLEILEIASLCKFGYSRFALTEPAFLVFNITCCSAYSLATLSVQILSALRQLQKLLFDRSVNRLCRCGIFNEDKYWFIDVDTFLTICCVVLIRRSLSTFTNQLTLANNLSSNIDLLCAPCLTMFGGIGICGVMERGGFTCRHGLIRNCKL